MKSNKLLKVNKVNKSFEGKKILFDVTFEINKGDIIGFIGPNGAGKSTAINIISTILVPDHGTILFQNKDIYNHEMQYKMQIGVVPQELAIFEDLSAYDNVKFFCSLYGFKKASLRKQVREALEFVGLWDRCSELPSKFSGGMKRRLNIACAIAHRPELLVMDEPTVGIDPQSRNHILEAVKTLNKRGTTIIYTSHYMEEVESLCNRILLLDNGNIIEDEEKQNFKSKYSKLGLNSLEEIFLHLTGTDLRDMEE